MSSDPDEDERTGRTKVLVQRIFWARIVMINTAVLCGISVIVAGSRWDFGKTPAPAMLFVLSLVVLLWARASRRLAQEELRYHGMLREITGRRQKRSS
jgi:hypothetical protein